MVAHSDWFGGTKSLVWWQVLCLEKVTDEIREAIDQALKLPTDQKKRTLRELRMRWHPVGTPPPPISSTIVPLMLIFFLFLPSWH